MKRITTILTAILILCFAAVSWGATLEGVTVEGGIVNAPAPCDYWPLSTNLESVTSVRTGTETHAGTNRTRVNPDTGLIEDVGANVARFENVGGFRALLIEPAGENLIQESTDFTTWWSNYNLVGITQNAGTAPDGTNTATLFEDDDNGLVEGKAHWTAATIADDDSWYTFSLFAKEGTEESVSLYFKFDGGAAIDTGISHFNIATKTWATGATSGYEDLSNGWVRVWLSLQNNSTGNTNIRCDIRVGAVAEATGTIYIWGAQVEESPVPTSLIHTSGGTETRATESGEPHFQRPTGLFDAKGTAIVWWRPGFSVDAPPTAPYGIVSVANTGSSLFRHGHATYRYSVSVDGPTNAIIAFEWSANIWYKLIVKWGYLVDGVEKFRVGVDSGSGVSWGSEFTFNGSYVLGTDIRLGFGLFSRMHIRGLRLFRDVLTDIEIDRE